MPQLNCQKMGQQRFGVSQQGGPSPLQEGGPGREHSFRMGPDPLTYDLPQVGFISGARHQCRGKWCPGLCGSQPEERAVRERCPELPEPPLDEGPCSPTDAERLRLARVSSCPGGFPDATTYQNSP